MELRGGSVDSTGDGAGIMVRTHGMQDFLKRDLAHGRSAIPEYEDVRFRFIFL